MGFKIKVEEHEDGLWVPASWMDDFMSSKHEVNADRYVFQVEDLDSLVLHQRNSYNEPRALLNMVERARRLNKPVIIEGT